MTFDCLRVVYLIQNLIGICMIVCDGVRRWWRDGRAIQPATGIGACIVNASGRVDSWQGTGQRLSRRGRVDKPAV